MISDRYNNCFWETTGELNCKPQVPNVNFPATDFSQHIGLAPISPCDTNRNSPKKTLEINDQMLFNHSPISMHKQRSHVIQPKPSHGENEQLGGSGFNYRFVKDKGDRACFRPVPPLKGFGNEPRPPLITRGNCLCRHPTSITDRVISKFPTYHIFNPNGPPHQLRNSHSCCQPAHSRQYVNPEKLAPRQDHPQRKTNQHCHKTLDRLTSDLDCRLDAPPEGVHSLDELQEDKGRHQKREQNAASNCGLQQLNSYFPPIGVVEQHLVQKLGRPSEANSHYSRWNKRALRFSVYGIFESIVLHKSRPIVEANPFPFKVLVTGQLYIDLPATCRYENLPVKYEQKLLTVNGPSLEFVCAIIAFLSYSSKSPFTFSCKVLKRHYLSPKILSNGSKHREHMRTIYRYLNATTERLRK